MNRVVCIFLSQPRSLKIWNHGVLEPGIQSHLLTNSCGNRDPEQERDLPKVPFEFYYPAALFPCCSFQDNTFLVDIRTSFFVLVP